MKKIIRVNVICFFSLILLSCFSKKTKKEYVSSSKVESSEIQNLMKPIDSFISMRMKESGIVGLGAAIIVNKELVWMKGYGHADKEKKTPFTSKTAMSIASISKTFTGALLMSAVESGLLSLDADINTYLPFKVTNPYFPKEKITLRQLATHTSSLVDDYEVYDKTYHYGNAKPEDLGDFLANYFTPNGEHYSKKNFVNKKPGTYRDYSNIAAGLAGYIIESVTGQKLWEYAGEKIFKRLKMLETCWSLAEVDLDKHSKQYEKIGDSLEIIPLYSLVTYPDGGVHTSVSDLSSFFIALLNQGLYQDTRILKKETVDEMLKFQFTEASRPENINLKEPNKNSGIFWSTKRDVTLIGHGGSDYGVSTDMFCNLSKEVGVILFSNTGGANTRAIFDELWKYGIQIKDL